MIRQKMRQIAALLVLGWMWSGCGTSTSTQTENYGLNTTADLILTAQNHVHGFGRSECFNCHVEINIHQENRLNTPATELARQMVSQQGISSCSGCHGKNGVTP